jgi:hypothetical protein
MAKLCASAMSADELIRNSMPGAKLAISHFADFQQKLH